jgi:hypothetical protein
VDDLLSKEIFDELKKALTSSSYLVMPDFTKPFEVITDASDFALGAKLLQERKAVAYESTILFLYTIGVLFYTIRKTKKQKIIKP